MIQDETITTNPQQKDKAFNNIPDPPDETTTTLPSLPNNTGSKFLLYL